MTTKQYVKVKTISVFEHTYIIPMQEGQSVTDHLDYVVCNEIEEFSQMWVDENILPNCTEVIDEEEVLALFDKENGYLASWSREKKLEWVNNNLRKEEKGEE